VRRVKQIAENNHATPAQIALAWILQKGDDFISIPGTKRRKYLEENLGAADITLTQDEMNTLDLNFSPGQVSGERYPAALQAMIDR
jgi:aryl-alcohol dehydrogenase-like predicted oxidoreductase